MFEFFNIIIASEQMPMTISSSLNPALQNIVYHYDKLIQNHNLHWRIKMKWQKHSNGYFNHHYALTELILITKCYSLSNQFIREHIFIWHHKFQCITWSVGSPLPAGFDSQLLPFISWYTTGLKHIHACYWTSSNIGSMVSLRRCMDLQCFIV